MRAATSPSPSPSNSWSSATRSPAMTCSSSRRPVRARRSPSASRWSSASSPAAGHTSALVLAPTRELAGQIVDELRTHRRRPRPEDRRRLRRRRLRPAEQGGAPRRHPRRHPRAARGPDRPRRRLARPRPHPRPRRGRPHARHGLQAGRRAGSSPRPRPSARPCSSRRRWRGRPARSPPPSPATPAATPRPPTRAPRPTSSTASSTSTPRAPSSTTWSSSCGDAESGPTLVFVRTKRGADRLVKRLRDHASSNAVAMHGDKSQRQREQALARFEAGKVDALIATDVAARGIDVAGITHVVNFDAPGDRDSYVHRIGRTGRAGRTRHGDQLRARRPGRRGPADGRRPRPCPRVQPRPPRLGALRVAAAATRPAAEGGAMSAWPRRTLDLRRMRRLREPERRPPSRPAEAGPAPPRAATA